MSGIPFHETRMGRRLIEHHIPALVEARQQIAAELKRLNDALEKRQPEAGDPDDPPA